MESNQLNVESMQEKFVISNDDNLKQLIIFTLMEKYRNYQGSNYYDKYSTDEEGLQNIPPDVVKEDCVWFVNWFSCGEFKVSLISHT